MSSQDYSKLPSAEAEPILSSSANPSIAVNAVSDGTDSKPSPNLYEITIPDNVRSGDTIYVEIPDTNKSYDVTKNAAAIGATVAGLVLGTIIAGPILGLITGGAALYGTTRSDKIGDAVRGVGAGTCICYNKTVEVANKYHLADKIKDAATITGQKMSDINQEYKITDRVTSLGASIGNSITKAKEVQR